MRKCISKKLSFNPIPIYSKNNQEMIRQQPQDQQEEKFYCSKHPGTEAVVFCEACSGIHGCTGYWCKDCDEDFHKFFPDHQREEPKHIETKACEKHPGHHTEEIFCWKTNTFHCSMCGYEEHIEGDTIPNAVKKGLEEIGKDYTQIGENIEKLSEQKKGVLFELSDSERNPTNLEFQFQEAKNFIQETFNQLREALDKKEKALMEEVEKVFNPKIENLNKEVSDLDELIEGGEKAMESYNELITTKKGVELMKGISVMKIEGEKEVATLNNYKTNPIIHNGFETITREREFLIERINNLGRIVDGTNIPAPQGVSAEDIRKDYISFSWNPVKLPNDNVSVTYQVFMKNILDPNSEWKELQNSSSHSCSRSNLYCGTNYGFKIYTICNGKRSVDYLSCGFKTVIFSFRIYSYFVLFIFFLRMY